MTLVLALVLAGCRQATVVDACSLEGDGMCPVCESDEQCHYTGNPCLATVYCAHEDAQIAVIEIGCEAATEYAWPDDATCRCVANACTASR
jgi:hypothetical protein